MMAAQRDYNIAKSAALKAFERADKHLLLEEIVRAIVDAVDDDREKQKRERDT